MRVRLLIVVFGLTIGCPHAGPQATDHNAWVAQVLKRMESIKPGMTRQALLSVFTTEGGISTGLQKTYVSRDCPFFKVRVEFQAVGRPSRTPDGRVTLIEHNRDIILKTSAPIIQNPSTD